MRKADVDPILRPTHLTMAQFRALVDSYAHLCEREPGLLDYEFRDELRLKHLTRKGKVPVDALVDTPAKEHATKSTADLLK